MKKDLAADEETHLLSGGISLHATMVSAFLLMGLELEEAQYVLTTLQRGSNLIQ